MLLLKIVLAIVFLAALGMLLLMIRTKVVGSQNLKKANAVIDPIVQKVQQGAPDAAELVAQGAAHPAIRSRLLRKLAEYGKADMVPAEWKTPEKVAESDLTFWLMHPNELNALPTGLQVVEGFPREARGRKGTAYLIKFYIDPPHPASKRGWMAGMAGTYWEDDKELSDPQDVFSEFIPFEQMTPAEHIQMLDKSRNAMFITPSK